MTRPLDEVTRPGNRILAKTFNDLRREIRRRTVTISGATAQLQTAGGLVARVGTGSGETVLIKTKTSISGRSGATPGAGTVYLVAFDGTSLVDGDEVGVRNVAAGGWSAGKYGLAALVDGVYWILAVEC